MLISCIPNDCARSGPKQVHGEECAVTQTGALQTRKKNTNQEMAGMDHRPLHCLPVRERMIYDRRKQFLDNNTAGNQRDHRTF